MYHRTAPAALAALLTITAAAAPAEAAYPGANGDIVFRAYDSAESEYDLFVVTPGEQPRRLTPDNPDWEQNPTWAPDGRSVALIRRVDSGDAGGELIVLDVSTGSERHLTRGTSDMQPTWSPDGRHLVFARYEQLRGKGDWELMAISASADPADGDDAVRLTSNTVNDTEPAWAPDGSDRLAFTSSESGHDEIHLSSLVRDEAGAPQGLRAVTPLTTGRYRSYGPAWAPDGSRLVVAHDPHRAPERVLVIEPTPSSAPTEQRLALVEDGGYATPSWTPDGTSVVYSRRTSAGATLHSVSWQGGEPQAVSGGVPGQQPDTQPVTATTVGETDEPTCDLPLGIGC